MLEGLDEAAFFLAGTCEESKPPVLVVCLSGIQTSDQRSYVKQRNKYLQRM